MDDESFFRHNGFVPLLVTLTFQGHSAMKQPYIFVLANCECEMTVWKSCKCGKYKLFEHLLFLSRN